MSIYAMLRHLLYRNNTNMLALAQMRGEASYVASRFHLVNDYTTKCQYCRVLPKSPEKKKHEFLLKKSG